MKLKKSRKINGFTSIELLAMLLILVIIGVVATQVFGTMIDEARIDSEKASFRAILTAIEAQKIYEDKIDYNGIELLKKIEYKGETPDEIYMAVRDKTKYATRVVFGKNCYLKVNGYDEIEYYPTSKCPTYNYSDIFQMNVDNMQAVIDSEPGINLEESGDYTSAKIVTKDDINIYQGVDPANYVALGDSCFRIVSYDRDSIKIIYDGINIHQTAANPCSHAYNGSIGRVSLSGTIDTLAFGTSQDWLDENNIIRTKFESIVNDTTISTDEDIVLGNAAENVIKLDKRSKAHLKKMDYYIGGVNEADVTTVVDNAIDIIAAQEKALVYNNYVGLLTISEYLSGSADPDCRNYKSSTNTCEKDNFLFKHDLRDLVPLFGSWTMNKLIEPLNEEVLYYPFMEFDYGYVTPFKIRPVLTLKGDTLFSGSGTYYNPYRVVY